MPFCALHPILNFCLRGLYNHVVFKANLDFPSRNVIFIAASNGHYISFITVYHPQGLSFTASVFFFSYCSLCNKKSSVNGQEKISHSTIQCFILETNAFGHLLDHILDTLLAVTSVTWGVMSNLSICRTPQISRLH